MPRYNKDAPDFVDLQNLCSSLGEDYAVVVYFTIRCRVDRVEVFGKTHSAPYTPDAPVQHVALVTFPIQQKKDMGSVLYTLAFDLWCQHDGGGATAAARGPSRTWQGRVEIPRRRNAQ